MTKDMTCGKPFPLILSFAVPLVAGNLIQQLYNFADGFIVARFVDKNAFAAVSSVGAVMFLIIGFVLGITQGFCIHVSQRFGAEDFPEMRRYIINGIYLLIGISIFLTVVCTFFTRHILELMNTPETIIDGAYEYLFIIFFGIIATAAYDYCASLLRAVGDSKTPLYFLIAACVTNIVLDIIFVGFVGMGVKGAAVATVISQGFAAVLEIIYIIKKFPVLWIKKEERNFSIRHSLKNLSLGLPMAFQYSITAFGVIVIQYAVNQLSSDSIAPVNAVGAASKIGTLTLLPYDSIGIAMANFCGQNIGAGKFKRIKEGMLEAVKIMLGYTVICSLFLMFFGKLAARLFINSGETETLEYAGQFLFYSGAVYVTLGILLLLRNAIQGMGYGILPMSAGIAEMLARCIIVFFVADKLKFTAISLSDPGAWIAADLLLIPAWFYCYRKSKKLLENNQEKISETQSPNLS